METFYLKKKTDNPEYPHAQCVGDVFYLKEQKF